MDGSSLSISFADSLPAYAIQSGPSEPVGDIGGDNQFVYVITTFIFNSHSNFYCLSPRIFRSSYGPDNHHMATAPSKSKAR